MAQHFFNKKFLIWCIAAGLVGGTFANIIPRIIQNNKKYSAFIEQLRKDYDALVQIKVFNSLKNSETIRYIDSEKIESAVMNDIPLTTSDLMNMRRNGNLKYIKELKLEGMRIKGHNFVWPNTQQIDLTLFEKELDLIHNKYCNLENRAKLSFLKKTANLPLHATKGAVIGSLVGGFSSIAVQSILNKRKKKLVIPNQKRFGHK